MRSRYQINDTDRAHFVTSTIVNWLPVFTSAACCEILVNAFSYCQQHKGLRIHGWIIMDNHFHAVVATPALSSVLSDLKKFTAQKRIEQIGRERRGELLLLRFLCLFVPFIPAFRLKSIRAPEALPSGVHILLDRLDRLE